jgi:hypothetical protein
MYIETRTTADQVLADVFRQVEFKANGLNSSVAQRRRSSSSVTNKQLRESIAELTAYWSMAMNVAGGFDQLPNALVYKVSEARDAARKLLAP